MTGDARLTWPLALTALLCWGCEPEPWVCPTYEPCDCAGNAYFRSAFFLPAGSLPAGHRLEVRRGAEVLGEGMVAADGSAWAVIETFEDVTLEGATVVARTYALDGAASGERAVPIPVAANARLDYVQDQPGLVESDFPSGYLDVRYRRVVADPEEPYPAELSEVLLLNLDSAATRRLSERHELAAPVTGRVRGRVGDQVAVFMRHRDGRVSGCWLPGGGFGGRCGCSRAQFEAGLCEEGEPPVEGAPDAGPPDGGSPDAGPMRDAGPLEPPI